MKLVEGLLRLAALGASAAAAPGGATLLRSQVAKAVPAPPPLPSPRLGLLGRIGAGGARRKRQPSPLGPPFFQGAEPVPGAAPWTQPKPGAVPWAPHYPAAMAATQGCHPKCSWTCGDADCDEVCEPVCAPPQCETACAPINPTTCTQRCEPPRCAIVCPSMHCEHGDCPQCKTVCGPPKCETVCADNCESKCSEPQCTWKCNPGQCEKPRCSLTCGGAKMCGFGSETGARPPPFGGGMKVVSKGLAAYDPAALGALPAATVGLPGGASPAPMPAMVPVPAPSPPAGVVVAAAAPA